MPKKDTRRKLGYEAENKIKQVYLNNEYTFIAQNFEYRIDHQTGRMGEIDLIMEKNGKSILAFIEVKARQNNNYGPAIQQITKKQLRSLYFAMQKFLLQNKRFSNYQIRFDIAIIENNKINIYPNAYSFDEIL
jgi:putative endonuclease